MFVATCQIRVANRCRQRLRPSPPADLQFRFGYLQETANS